MNPEPVASDIVSRVWSKGGGPVCVAAGRQDESFRSEKASSDNAAVLGLWREQDSEGEGPRRETRAIGLWLEHVRRLR